MVERVEEDGDVEFVFVVEFIVVGTAILEFYPWAGEGFLCGFYGV